MKSFLQTIFLTFIFGSVVFAQTENKKHSQNARDEQELIRLENATVTATDKRDFTMLDRLIADDFVGTTSKGVLKNKAETIASWTNNAPKNSQNEMTTTSVTTTLTEMRVRINGKTAVVTGLDRAVFKNRDAGETISEARFTDIWEKRKIGWQMIAGHVSRIPPNGSQTKNALAAKGAEEEKLRDLRKRLDKSFALKDAETQAEVFAADGIFIAGGPQPLEGRAAYRDSLLRVLQRPNILLAHELAKLEVSSGGDMAYELGDWKETWKEPDGLTTLTGRYFTVWKKVDGAWQITAETLKPYNCIGSNYCKK